MSHCYPSDIDREQFNKIKPLLESARKKTRPRAVDLYDVICGISYLLKIGYGKIVKESSIPVYIWLSLLLSFYS